MYNQIFSELHSNQYLTENENLEVSNYKREKNYFSENVFTETATVKINNQLVKVSRYAKNLPGENKFRILGGSFGILK